MEQTQFCTDETNLLVRDSRIAVVFETVARERQGSLTRALQPFVTSFSRNIDTSDKFYVLVIIILVPAMLMFSCLWFLRRDDDDGQTVRRNEVEKPRDATQGEHVEKPQQVVSIDDVSSGIMKPAYFCTDFVVPTGLECHVVLPSMQSAFSQDLRFAKCSSISREIMDKTGKPLFVLQVKQIEAQTPSSFFECVQLRKHDGSEVGSCELQWTSEGGQRRLHCMILLSSGEHFARLQEEGSDVNVQERSFVLSGVHPQNPWILRIHGDIANHNVEIANIKTGRLMATLRGPELRSADKGYYEASFGSMSDTTLMILALVAIDRLVALVPKPVIKGT